MSSPDKFCGEGDAAIDRLVDACRPQNRPSLEAPSLPHLIGRELTPYFGFSEPAEARKTPVNVNNKRKGASPKQVRPKPGTSAPTSPSSPTSRAVEVPAECEKVAIISSSPSELQNKQKNKGIKATRNPKPTQQVHTPIMAYACPAMFMSPKPETLPLPSTGLLRNAIRPIIMAPALVAA